LEDFWRGAEFYYTEEEEEKEGKQKKKVPIINKAAQ
jgi:hypothetical protein